MEKLIFCLPHILLFCYIGIMPIFGPKTASLFILLKQDIFFLFAYLSRYLYVLKICYCTAESNLLIKLIMIDTCIFEQLDQSHILIKHLLLYESDPFCRLTVFYFLADGGCNSSCRPTGDGHVRHLWSLRQSLPPARQKEEIWNKSSSQNTEPSLQWNIYLQGEQIMARVYYIAISTGIFRPIF